MSQPARSRHAVAIHADDTATLHEIVRTRPGDYGCRPRALPHDRRGFALHAILTPDEHAALRAAGHDVELLTDTLSLDRRAAATIGKGDRFDGGTIAPRGLGSRGDGDDRDLGGVMNVDEIGSAVQGLVNEYGIATFSTPNPTHEGAGGVGGIVGGIDPDRYHVYFTAGVHARERGGPDNIIYFIADLLYAQRHGGGLTYGARSYSAADVAKALSAGIVFFPLVNPDGVRYDQQTDLLWRKNRNPASAVAGNPDSIGVDINRNYDFLWDFRALFDPSVTGSTALASDDPGEETFHGTAAFSEPETRNVAWVLDRFPRLRWYMDIHSAAGDLLYPWGDDNDQTGDPAQSFTNPAWDGRRGVLGVQDYREWIGEADLSTVSRVARRVAAAMHGVGKRPYLPEQAVGLYATSGTADDYAFSRHITNRDLNKVYGFTMEFGHPTNFYPTVTEFHDNVIDTAAGFMEFCLAAVDSGLG
jgi:hypothetical protein